MPATPVFFRGSLTLESVNFGYCVTYKIQRKQTEEEKGNGEWMVAIVNVLMRPASNYDDSAFVFVHALQQEQRQQEMAQVLGLEGHVEPVGRTRTRRILRDQNRAEIRL
jgi:hypothetical protein